MDGGGGHAAGGGQADEDGGGESPDFEEYERPPLRHIDKYVKAECPCLSTVRYTIALMTCLGFIISFGMRCNMGMAKLKFQSEVNHNLWHFLVAAAVSWSSWF